MPHHESQCLRVLVADDHELVRFSLKLALQKHTNIDLVGLASNGREAVEMVEQYRPDVVILDLQMPIVDGLSASNQIKSQHPHTRIVAYSSVQDPQIEVMIQTAQIDAFCEKGIPVQELIEIVMKQGESRLKAKE
ncbi:response regulator transcription factor [Oculatella sp. LEGE 06141]|uniref:response regulator n=1 Tax=Oculatella sp. LEGE 06141 TaxID=1828648 RepID=UPI0018808C70|nr:response regulator transcription factor [Oculatella sp. LEGE 06141]MBE9177331.1 response regulator transcription factor [Oculatella sp. LEGE 06141]